MNLLIRNVPDELVRRLKERAKRNHRSLQGEMRAILDEAVMRSRKTLTVAEVSAEVERLGIRSPSESVEIIRKTRDAR
jgi:plasmid stability protein